jgi:hypothetical protein
VTAGHSSPLSVPTVAVALLPVSATVILLFDPLHRTHTPVHSRLAATLAPGGLYLPFPIRWRWRDLLTFGSGAVVRISGWYY